MPLSFAFLLRHAFVLYVAVLGEKLVKSEAPLLFRLCGSGADPKLPLFPGGLIGVDTEIFPGQECTSGVQEVVRAIGVIIEGPAHMVGHGDSAVVVL